MGAARITRASVADSTGEQPRSNARSIDGSVSRVSCGNRQPDGRDGLVAKGDVVGGWFMRVCPQEVGEAVPTSVALQLPPNRVEIRRQCGQLGRVRRQGAVEHRGVQQSRAIRAPIGIGQDGETREVDRSASGERDMRPPDSRHVRAVNVVPDRTKHAPQGRDFALFDWGQDGQAFGRHQDAEGATRGRTDRYGSSSAKNSFTIRRSGSMVFSQSASFVQRSPYAETTCCFFTNGL